MQVTTKTLFAFTAGLCIGLAFDAWHISDITQRCLEYENEVHRLTIENGHYKKCVGDLCYLWNKATKQLEMVPMKFRVVEE